MKKKIVFIVIAVVAIIIGAICFFSLQKDDSVIDTADAIYPASEETGAIAEKVIGDPDTASVVLYEYADFGCSHCADWNKTINELLEKYEGKIALVFRNYDLGFKNGPAAARAATAAHIQGYFKEYKDLLFANQAEWYYGSASELEELFVEYFNEVSDGKGDVNKFKEDMKSDAVKKRLKFEQRMGKKVNLHGTPLFRIDGEQIDLGKLVETIENKLK